MDTEQKSKEILSKLKEAEHYLEIINVDDRHTNNIKTLQDAQKLIYELVDKIEQLHLLNDMYMNFIKFNKMNYFFVFTIALIALFLGVTALLFVLK